MQSAFLLFYFSIFLPLKKSKARSDDMNIVENVPEITPNNRANINPFKFSPPKINIANTTKRTVNEVFIVLPSVPDIESLNNCASVLSLPSFRFSLIRSKIITVSFIEYPRTVSIAAMKSWLISILNGITLWNNENAPNMIVASNAKPIIATSENCHLLNRSNI